jgi:fructose 1,6-bisphosphate aldolase/phosphatase
MKTTLSVIKADIGGHVGHSSSHPEIIKLADTELQKAKKKGTIKDYHVTACGDDLQLIMTHTLGVESKKIHSLAWDTFCKGTEKAKKLKLYGAGQDLLSDAFSGNLKGMGPGFAEMEFEERKSEPVLVFMADKTEPGAWNYPLFKIFADPFNTIGLVIDPNMHGGFRFEVHDVMKSKKVFFDCPEQMYDLLVLIGAPGRYVIKHVFRRADGEIAASTSTTRLSLIAGKYVGKDDPVLAVRAQHGLPAVGEVMEPWSYPHMVAGWMRGSHHGPLMPTSVKQANPTRFDGPPRVTCLGFQIANCKLGEPRDMFDDPSYDRARDTANAAADYIRRMGPFEPHRLDLEQMEYTTLPRVQEKLKEKWKGLG